MKILNNKLCCNLHSCTASYNEHYLFESHCHINKILVLCQIKFFFLKGDFKSDQGFVCELCVAFSKEGIMEPGEEISFFDQVDFVKSYLLFGKQVNCSGGTEAVVTARSFFDQVDFVKSYLLFGKQVNCSGGTEAVVTARSRIGRIKFRQCGELLDGRKLSLKMKRRIH